jgi:hypothetical protein
VLGHLERLGALATQDLLDRRFKKFSAMGKFDEHRSPTLNFGFIEQLYVPG